MSSNQPTRLRRDRVHLAKGNHAQFTGTVTAQKVDANKIVVNSIGDRRDVTQATDINTAVRTTGRHGIITLQASGALSANASTAFTFNNQYIASDAVITVSLSYDGTDGIPVVSLGAQVDGSVLVRISNAHSSTALNDTAGQLRVHYMVQGQPPDLFP